MAYHPESELSEDCSSLLKGECGAVAAPHPPLTLSDQQDNDNNEEDKAYAAAEIH